MTDKARGTVSHVHGGIGIGNDGEVHRHSVAARLGEFALGGATAQLRRVGACVGTG